MRLATVLRFIVASTGTSLAWSLFYAVVRLALAVLAQIFPIALPQSEKGGGL